MDTLYNNQSKILELTKLKTFVELTTEESKNVKTVIDKEKTIRKRNLKDVVRSSESDTNDEES